MAKPKMLHAKDWETFRAAGLLWWVNMILHTFGWALVVVVDEQTQDIVHVYPARCKFRGFDGKHNTEGYIAVSEHLQKNIDQLVEEARN